MADRQQSRSRQPADGEGVEGAELAHHSSSDPNLGSPSLEYGDLTGEIRNLSLAEPLDPDDDRVLIEEMSAEPHVEKKSGGDLPSEVGVVVELEKETDVSAGVGGDFGVEVEGEIHCGKIDGDFDGDGREFGVAYVNVKANECLGEEGDRNRRIQNKNEEKDDNESASGNMTSGFNENESDTGNLDGDLENENYDMMACYPLRPGAELCTFYMRNGTCKFGMKCKFSHPSRRKNQVTGEKGKPNEENLEKQGQTECKYYLTSGGCKFGKDCRYSHGRVKTAVVPILEFNFLGLPIRPGEKECTYYIRTGTCKYESNCKFNHPDPTAEDNNSHSGLGNVEPTLASQSTMSSWSSSRGFNHASPCGATVFPPTKGSPSPNQQWNGFQIPVLSTSEQSLPVPPAFALRIPATEPSYFPHHQQQATDFPERPGQPECIYFLRTGDCKFKSSCKFHHPKSRAPTTALGFLSNKGMPLRPNQNICSHYNRYGICKFGPSCKFDHPVNYGKSTSASWSGHWPQANQRSKIG